MALNFTFEYYLEFKKNGNGFSRLGKKMRGNQCLNCLSFMLKTGKGLNFCSEIPLPKYDLLHLCDRLCVLLLTKKLFHFGKFRINFPDWIWAHKQIFFRQFSTLLNYFVCLRFGYSGSNIVLFCNRHPGTLSYSIRNSKLPVCFSFIKFNQTNLLFSCFCCCYRFTNTTNNWTSNWYNSASTWAAYIKL